MIGMGINSKEISIEFFTIKLPVKSWMEEDGIDSEDIRERVYKK